MKQRLLLAGFGMALFLSSCKKESTTDPTDPVVSSDALAPDGFNFSTSKNVSLDLRLRTNDDQPLTGVLVNVYSKSEKPSLLYSAFTDVNGQISETLNIPARLDSLIVDAAYIGLMRNAVAVINNGAVSATLGGKTGFSGNIIPVEGNSTGRYGVNPARTADVLGTTVVSYFGSYDNNGRPVVLETPDVISAELLSYINTSLPESRAVPNFHPEYLSSSAETNLNIEKTSDVWITFVHEGAGYMNSLAFYTYRTGTPPQALSDIDSIKLVIPNASLSGSGGAMRSGDKVLLGRFQPGTSIGFVLLQNAWNSTAHTVNANATKFFSDDILNNEKPTFKRHTVLLHDDKHKLFLTSFEDLQRDGGASDEDFNDLVFYATSNPVEGIALRNVKPIDVPTDADGDGISDVYDKFPNDPKRALVKYFPSDESWGTLAFEDIWPYTGDYDLNDLVVDYHYTSVVSGQNKTVEMLADFAIRGVGAAQKNGFAVQLPVSPDKISSITGQRFTSNYITTTANGTEAGQSKAVFVPFDDPKALINTTSVFVNVYNGRTYVKSDTAHVQINFTTPLAASDLGTAPYNPFLISGQRRGYEIHLPGNKPTDKADLKLLGSGRDNSDAAKNKYYLSANNWPWALSFVESFDHPTETSKITSAYSNFQKWAKSGGVNNADWYMNKTGYRAQSLIYIR